MYKIKKPGMLHIPAMHGLTASPIMKKDPFAGNLSVFAKLTKNQSGNTKNRLSGRRNL